MLEMRPSCEKCERSLEQDGEAWICSYECTFCTTCVEEMKYLCPNCGGELVKRPRQNEAS